jgi:nitric oxide reductase activation protein
MYGRYREFFDEAIQGLFDDGWLGPDRKEVTEKFFELLKCSPWACFDLVRKAFIEALNPRTLWLMDLPEVFTGVIDLGRQFADFNLNYGTGYFKILCQGGFGGSPEQVSNLITFLRRLMPVSLELAFAFLKGYRHLIDRLEPSEIELYMKEGLRIFEKDRPYARAFMDGTAKSAEGFIQLLTRECRLEDMKPSLERLLKALVGYEIEVLDLGTLDGDLLMIRRPEMVCMYRWLYLPPRIRRFDSETQNRNWYMLMAVVAAGMLSENSFCKIHGHPEYMACQDLVGGNPLHLNLFQILEYVRVLRRIKKRWPGARNLIDFGLRTDFELKPPDAPADHLFHDLIMSDASPTPALQIIQCLADQSVNAFDTETMLHEDWVSRVSEAYPGLDKKHLRRFGFLPDFIFPAKASTPPEDDLIEDLKKAVINKSRDREKDETLNCYGPGGRQENGGEGGIQSCFLYDEWSQFENKYHRDHCFLYEKRPREGIPCALPFHINEEIRRVRQVFELFKPELLRREKYLEQGDMINHDLLVDYLVQCRREPSPKVNFYEKLNINQRDLAVFILMDVSGSTREFIEQKRVIDIIKQATLILGQGLASLGDRFSISGFSGNGRENCEFFVYKDFDEKWDRDTIEPLLSANPLHTTRMGAALRHSGYRLAHIGARTRLIVLITDGKPNDYEYDPQTRYAHYDVRMACEENERQGIHTFCISTEENNRADLEIMFRKGRFAICPDIRQLPRVLPKLYLKITT